MTQMQVQFFLGDSSHPISETIQGPLREFKRGERVKLHGAEYQVLNSRRDSAIRLIRGAPAGFYEVMVEALPEHDPGKMFTWPSE